MNKLSLKNRQNKWRPEVFYDDIRIDGLYFDEWFAQFECQLGSLLSAFDLLRENDTQKVWFYLGQLQDNDRYFVPVLACPDDLDLLCSVVVAEQMVEQNCVKWLRFGFLLDNLEKQDANDIQWLTNIPPLIFDKDNFIAVFSEFLTVIKNRNLEDGIQLNIKLPADRPKEDWELIVESWYQ